MGYHVTVLRTSGGVDRPITSAELTSARLDNPGWLYEESDQSLSYRNQAGEEVVTLWLDDGKLWTKNPDDQALAVMLRLAGTLGARVRGDELETYRSPDETYVHPDDAALVSEAERSSARSSRNARIRHILFRGYQIAAVSFFAFFAVRYLTRL